MNFIERLIGHGNEKFGAPLASVLHSSFPWVPLKLEKQSALKGCLTQTVSGYVSITSINLKPAKSSRKLRSLQKSNVPFSSSIFTCVLLVLCFDMKKVVKIRKVLRICWAPSCTRVQHCRQFAIAKKFSTKKVYWVTCPYESAFICNSPDSGLQALKSLWVVLSSLASDRGSDYEVGRNRIAIWVNMSQYAWQADQ